jgi:Ni,Fe-hydrogenase III large subunit/Ni,Fe-hydrogenase III component G
MSDIAALLRVLEESELLETIPYVPRERQPHCTIRPANVPSFTELMCGRLGAHLILIVADDRRATRAAFHLHYVFAHPVDRWLVVAFTYVSDLSPELPSVAIARYSASRFEREIQDLFGVRFAGHPDPRPLVRHGFWPDAYHPLRKGAVAPSAFEDDGRPFPFKTVSGEGVYEIPVGPVHAGVIEPGHFRFSVLGETIINMKSRLYFTHKGTEKLFEDRAPADGVELAERVSGDTSVGHALAYCQAIESLTRIEAPRRARYIRVVLLELERLYNHIADFGMIANDTGFAIGQAHCSRIRESLLRLNKHVTGSRLLRGVVVPGGVTRDLREGIDVEGETARVLADFDEIAGICLRNTLLADRLEGTGVLTRTAAGDYGVLGFVARASGVDLDARRDYPFAAYDELAFEVPVMTSGDVKARTLVRLEEARQSVSLIGQACRALSSLPEEPLVTVSRNGFEPFEPAFGIVEGWRGRIVHSAMLNEDGRLHRVKIVDPSFFNWPALSRALVDNIVPDFPLCNKSFNQSYSGNDL